MEEFKKVPGWEHFPLPEVLYTTYNIPKPKPYDSLKAYLRDHEQTLMMPADAPVETRKGDGTVREVGALPLPEITIETKALTDESDGARQQDSHPPSDDSIGPNDSKIQESESPQRSRSQSVHDA